MKKEQERQESTKRMAEETKETHTTQAGNEYVTRKGTISNLSIDLHIARTSKDGGKWKDKTGCTKSGTNDSEKRENDLYNEVVSVREDSKRDNGGDTRTEHRMKSEKAESRRDTGEMSRPWHKERCKKGISPP